LILDLKVEGRFLDLRVGGGSFLDLKVGGRELSRPEGRGDRIDLKVDTTGIPINP
jgi:hypothetical protein